MSRGKFEVFLSGVEQDRGPRGYPGGLFAGVEVAGDFERLQIDDDNVVVGRASHVRHRAVGLHLDAGGAASHSYPLDYGSRGNSTLPSARASEASPRTARRGRATGGRRGPVGARWGGRGGGTAAAAELPRTAIHVRIPGRRRGVLRIAIAPRLAGVLGILEASALGEGASGVLLLRGRAGRAVLGRLARCIAAVVGLGALPGGGIIRLLAVIQRAV